MRRAESSFRRRAGLCAVLAAALAHSCTLDVDPIGETDDESAASDNESATSTGVKEQKECADYCRAREAKGCAGLTSTCTAVCNASFFAAENQGACSTLALEAERCSHSAEVVELGCKPKSSEVDALCEESEKALEACMAERDG